MTTQLPDHILKLQAAVEMHNMKAQEALELFKLENKLSATTYELLMKAAFDYYDTSAGARYILSGDLVQRDFAGKTATVANFRFEPETQEKLLVVAIVEGLEGFYRIPASAFFSQSTRI